MSFRKIPPLIAILFMLPTIAWGANAVDVLKKARMADQRVSYRGMKTAVVSLAGKPANCAIKVVHLLPDKTRTEYFTPSALAGMIVIENGPRIWKYSPSERAWEECPCCKIASSQIIHEDAIRNYDIRLLGTDRIAGRPAYVIHAVPRSGSEFAHRIWVDKDCYLVIGTQVETPRGTVLTSSRYSSIQINPRDISQSIFKVSGRVKSASGPDEISFRIIKPTYIPRGYRLVGVGRMCANGLACAHIQFSNGSTVISLFERKADGDREPVKIESKMTHALTWAVSGVRFTLIGDVPCPELRKIADSTR